MNARPAEACPPALRVLLAELRRAIREQCPDASVRVTYAPFQNVDAFVEVSLSGPADPAALAPLMEPTFHLADRPGYTICVLLRPPEGAA
ncbi:MAG TPA: hypothetical protein VKY74_23950 [Chloroflexia bacterium]|nr:hypothetical protein [Chloroflexia bacterium]